VIVFRDEAAMIPLQRREDGPEVCAEDPAQVLLGAPEAIHAVNAAGEQVLLQVGDRGEQLGDGALALDEELAFLPLRPLRGDFSIMKSLLDAPALGDADGDLAEARRHAILGARGHTLKILDEHGVGAAVVEADLHAGGEGGCEEIRKILEATGGGAIPDDEIAVVRPAVVVGHRGGGVLDDAKLVG
jgi:hypothetical protein